MSLYHQVQGGKQLRLFLIVNQREQQYACTFGMPGEQISLETLTNAIQQLQQAIQENHQNAQAYLLLGQAWCAFGDGRKAVKAYQEYTRLRPENPLGYIELALATEMTGDLSQPTVIKNAWETVGITPALFLQLGNDAFVKEDYPEAARNYQHAWFSLGSLSSADFFRWAIATIRTRHTLPTVIPTEIAQIHSLSSGKVKINGSQLQWVRDHPSGEPNYGDPLGKYPITKKNIGVMWWSGPAVAFIEIDQEGFYKFTIRAQHTLPQPIQLRFEHNLETIAALDLTKGDLSWEEFSTRVYLSPGIHLVGIRYLNNAIIDGVDRDAYIEWIELEQE